MGIDEKIFGKKVIVCCGSGGVGKTTTAAAIALEAAARGKKAIVLTIDPAKRLATAMGLDTLENEPKEVPLASGTGRLFAMMLDTKRTFDRLIEKYAPDDASRSAILNNRLYQHMSNMIAGSQEYMAMEKLYELYHEGDFDLMVLDTPPTRHALDFLDAPRKMVNITENSLLKWFLKPGLFAGRVGFGILGKGAEKILSVFDRLAGFSFLHELSEMIALIGGLLGGFHGRARSVYELLRKNFVGFLLITSPSSVAIQDALYFYQRIRDEELPFLGFVINRIHEPGGAVSEKDLPSLSPRLREKVVVLLRNYEQLALRDQRAITLLKKMGGKKAFYIPVPLFETDVHDLEGLKKINEALFG
jgi:anion-transporting  ArsA/GET3 family ATPase